MQTAEVETAGMETAGMQTAGMETAGMETAGMQAAQVQTAAMETAGMEAEEIPAFLAKVADFLEPVGLQEETEFPALILEEFVRNSRKKDKLLYSQLQVVDFLQNFLAQEDNAQGLNPLDSEDMSRKKAVDAKEQWKELKASYLEHVEAIRSSVRQVLPQFEEARRKHPELQGAFELLQAKKQEATEKHKEAQKQWLLQQAKHLQSLQKTSLEVKEQQIGTRQKLEQLSQELEALQQQAEQEKDKLKRNCTYLQLMYTLQGKLPVSEGTVTTEDALPPQSP